MTNALINQMLLAVFAACLSVSVVHAQPPGGPQPAGVRRGPEGSKSIGVGVAPAWKEGPDKHPLMPVLRWAKEALPRIEHIDSYSARLIEHERINGKLQSPKLLAIKVLRKPFSVYVKCLAPKSVKGQEAIYVEGANDGKMWAHCVGIRGLLGTLSLDPADPHAMQGELYPVTQVGFLALAKRLIEAGESNMKYGECTVTSIEHAKINDRPCHCIEVVHPRPRRISSFTSRVFSPTTNSIFPFVTSSMAGQAIQPKNRRCWRSTRTSTSN